MAGGSGWKNMLAYKNLLSGPLAWAKGKGLALLGWGAAGTAGLVANETLGNPVGKALWNPIDRLRQGFSNMEGRGDANYIYTQAFAGGFKLHQIFAGLMTAIAGIVLKFSPNNQWAKDTFEKWSKAGSTRVDEQGRIVDSGGPIEQTSQTSNILGTGLIAGATVGTYLAGKKLLSRSNGGGSGGGGSPVTKVSGLNNNGFTTAETARRFTPAELAEVQDATKKWVNKSATSAGIDAAEEVLETGAKKAGWLKSIFGSMGGRGKILGLALGGMTVAGTMYSANEANASELPTAEGETVANATVTPDAIHTSANATAPLAQDVDPGLGHRIMVSADAIKDGAGNFVGNTLGLVHWAGNGIGGWFGNDNIMPDAMSGENISKAINNTTDFMIYDVAGASTKALGGFMEGGLEGAWDAATTRYKPEIMDATDASLHSNISLGTELGLGVAAVAFTGGAASAGLAGTFANAANTSRFINAGVKAARFTTGVGVDIFGNNMVANNALAHRPF